MTTEAVKIAALPDSLNTWSQHYQQVAVHGIRSTAVAKKISLHLRRFIQTFEQLYGHDRISGCVSRDVLIWRQSLLDKGLAPATINNHLASLSAFATWVHAQAPTLFPKGDPTKGIGELPLPTLEPRVLSDQQVHTLKNLCDRLEQFHRKKGKQWAKGLEVDELPPLRIKARPCRDRAIVLTLLSTGLRREELTKLNLGQLVPHQPEALRSGRRAKLTEVKGKGKTERVVFLSKDARQALADYIEQERPQDVDSSLPIKEQPLFFSPVQGQPRQEDGRLSPRSINLILEQISRWHDAELDKRQQQGCLSPLRPHDLRHTFAFRLAKVTGADSYELERRLGHQSQRYIQRYTNPPDEIAAEFIESF